MMNKVEEVKKIEPIIINTNKSTVKIQAVDQKQSNDSNPWLLLAIGIGVIGIGVIVL